MDSPRILLTISVCSLWHSVSLFYFQPKMSASSAKLTVVIGSLAPGGAERVCVNLCNLWALEGRSIQLVILKEGGKLIGLLDAKVSVTMLGAARTATSFAALAVCLRQADAAPVLGFGVEVGAVLAALKLTGLISNPIIVMAPLCFAQIGVSSVPPMFWPLPASFLTGASAAAGIAAINSLGNLSGFAGPFAMGYLKDLTGNFTVGLLLLAGCAVLGAAVVLTLRIDAKREQSSGEVALAH